MDYVVIVMKKHISSILIVIVIVSNFILMGARDSFSNTVNFGIYIAQIVLLFSSLLFAINTRTR